MLGRLFFCAALVLSLVGCSANALSIRLLLADPPEPDAFDNVTTVRLSVSGEGLEVRQSQAPRQSSELKLPEVPYGNARVIVVEGLDVSSAVVSRGESAPFDLSEDGPSVVDVPFARADCAKEHFQDEDRDGFGVDSSRVLRCVAPADWVTRGGDCDDAANIVNPGQSGFFEQATPGGGYDYDCDGKEEPEITGTAKCKKTGGSCGGDGWSGSVPPCGGSGTFVRCVDGNPCNEVTETRTQRCR